MRRRSAISFILLIRGGNPCVFRSSIYRISVSSSDEVNLYWGSRFLVLMTDLRSRSRRVDRGMLYTFEACVVSIFLVVRIASIARTILASWVCTGIALLLCRGAIEFGDRDAVEKVAGRP